MRRKMDVIVLVLAVVLMGSCGVEALHSFVWFGAKSKRSEAKLNLRKLCLAQTTLLAENKPAPTFRGLLPSGFGGENRYAYLVSPGGPLERPDHSMKRPEKIDPEATGTQSDRKFAPYVEVSEADVPPLLGGVKLGANGSAWVMVAAGNIDVDPELDVLSISTEARQTPGGRVVGSCEPYLEHDDIPAGPISGLFQ